MNRATFDNLTSGMHDVNRRKEAKALIEKWERTGLLKNLGEDKMGFSGYGKKAIIARLLENTASEIRSQMLRESTQTGDIANYNKIAFPLVRRVFGQLLADKLVSIQPMSLPAGLIFYLDFKFDRNKNMFGANKSVYGDLENTPPNNNPQLDGVGSQTSVGGFYRLQTGYPKRIFKLTSTTAPTFSGVTATSGALGVAVSGYNFTLASSAVTDLGSLQEIRPVLQGEINLDGTKTFRTLSAIHSLTGQHFNATNFDPSMTYVTGGKLQVFTTKAPAEMVTAWTHDSGTAVHLAGPARTSVSVDTGTNSFGDFESTSAIPEIKMSISSLNVSAQTRKLKTEWTPELAQDINAYHAVDAEVELTQILSELLSIDIDRDILSNLLNGAKVKAAWSRTIGRYVKWNTNDVITDVTLTSSNSQDKFFGTQQDWYQTLGETINHVSNQIHKLTLRSKANWLVTSPEISTILESLASWKPNAVFSTEEVTYSMGIEKVGTVANRFTVYVDPYFLPNQILVGYKGPGFLDTGFVYAPYVPLVITPTILDPHDFTPRKGVMNRAAMAMVRPEFYGRVVVTDLGIIGAS